MSRYLLRMMIVATLLSISFQLPARGEGRELSSLPEMRQFTTADGLPTNAVFGLAEDNSGYMWFATRDGLARFDGTSFKVWRTDRGLASNDVRHILVDGSDTIWLGTQSGLQSFDSKRSRFSTYGGNDPDVAGRPVLAMEIDAGGSLWFSTATGVYRIGGDGNVHKISIDGTGFEEMIKAGVTSIRRAEGKTMMAASAGALARWNGRNFDIVNFPTRYLPGFLGISPDEQGGVWINSSVTPAYIDAGGVWRLGKFGSFDIKDVGVLYFRSRDGSWWGNGVHGLSRIWNNGQVSQKDYPSGKYGESVGSNWSAGIEAKDGSMWFSTYGYGVWRAPSRWKSFAVYRASGEKEKALGHAGVISVAAKGRDQILVGELDDDVDLVTLGSDGVSKFARKAGSGGVNGMAFDSHGGTWVSSVAALSFIDPDGVERKRWTQESKDDATNQPGNHRVVIDRNGSVWLVSRSGYFQIRSRRGAIIRTISPGQAGVPVGTALTLFDLSPGGEILFSSQNGLFRWVDDDHFERVDGIPEARVSSFYFDGGNDDSLVIATAGSVARYSKMGGSYKKVDELTTADGLPETNLSGLVFDENGVAWIGSNTRGLVRIDFNNRSVRTYATSDGMPSQEVTSYLVRSGSGEIAIGTISGLFVFDPNVFGLAIEPKIPVVDRFEARRSDGSVVALGEGKELSYPWVDLHVAARMLDFDGPDKHEFRFLLSGYDDVWMVVDRSGERIFPKLPPGSYLLEIQARTAGGPWSASRKVNFAVLPAWWQSWQACVAYLGVGAVLLFWLASLYRHRLHRLNDLRLAIQQVELAQQASEAKSQFLATLGHEIRTPMTGVLGMSELLLAKNLPETERGQVQSIHRAGEHLLRLVNDALDMARIEAGKLELDVADFALRPLVNELIALMAPIAERRGLSFHDEIDADAPVTVRGDRTRVAQILLNLIGNAVKFTEQGFVSLDVSGIAGGGVRFVVSDSGPGMAPEQRQRIFERFAQADGARTASRYGGSGLGLAISQELARAMGGQISVDSELGKGTRFTVELPLPAGNAAVAKAPRTRRSPPQQSRILLVEDDPTVADVVAGLLRAQGHEVVHAPHALAALVDVGEAPFDVAFLDLDLPGLDGFALARQLRDGGFTEPLVAITARADMGAEREALAAGFDGFLRKPVTGQMLADAIGPRTLH